MYWAMISIANALYEDHMNQYVYELSTCQSTMISEMAQPNSVAKTLFCQRDELLNWLRTAHCKFTTL